MSHKKKMEISDLGEKQRVIEQLARDNDWENANAQLEVLEKKQTILQRLLDRFPGYYGKYLSLHFAAFLNEPITTEKQQVAFERIISYLDGIDIVVPDDLKDYFDEATNNENSGIMSSISKSLSVAVQNPEQFMIENKNVMEQYMKLMSSDEYKQSPVCRMKELLKKFSKQNGYYDIFIPAMKELSSSYNQYHDDLLKANEAFTERYSDDLVE